ncbi:hypothetical protein EYC84_004987 [Monilinia fructicola]|uniref:C2H2-type domain-containing protein n=1 Tax=Monilinia fructicola TaxID=38448 RepID=A0A5M9JW39_MONFR|nr:hypothetical protein EYC84_004987 [Monilinia fructicola]
MDIMDANLDPSSKLTNDSNLIGNVNGKLTVNANAVTFGTPKTSTGTSSTTTATTRTATPTTSVKGNPNPNPNHPQPPPPPSSTSSSSKPPSKSTATTTPSSSSSTSSSSSKPPSKPPSKSTATTTPSSTSSTTTTTTTGNRFQCPQCPKNFTRIENLTRHQANHDEVGKFACAICRKRFTRSDLLSRHRRIHNQNNGPGKRAASSKSHMIQPSASPPSQPQPISNLILGLQVPENFNPSTWDGFMLYSDSPNVYMGSYDADISWTLDCFSQDSWSNMDLDFVFAGPQFVQPDPHGQSNDLDAEGDEEDWPDKVSRLESPPRWGPKSIPRLGPESWHAVTHEARASSFTVGPRQRVNDILRSTLLSMLQIELPSQSGDTILDCQYATLFNVQSYISRAETTNCVFPCPEQHWEAPSPQAWKMLLVSMLNPTGLMGTMGNHALDIGAGLLSRRKWLIDALDSWTECYGASSEEQSVAGKLLCSLGYVSLDVSLSDVHLMAGRSSNRQDCDFAAVNLRFWANSDIAGNTMKNVYEMLALSEQCIRMRDSRGGDGVLGTMGMYSSRPEEASYEIAVCLFTGGLVCWVYKELRTGLVGRGEG